MPANGSSQPSISPVAWAMAGGTANAALSSMAGMIAAPCYRGSPNADGARSELGKGLIELTFRANFLVDATMHFYLAI